MAKQQGDISRRELLARGIALGGAAMVGSSTELFGQETFSEGTLPPAAPDPLGDLRANIRGDLLTPAEPAYDEARKLWNGMIDKRPAAIVRCTGNADVINTVKFARSNDLAVSVRAGGHNVAGKALRDGALAIDLSSMKGLRVDPRAKTARAQAGVTWGQFDRETVAFNLASTGGTISTVGIAGLTLGGGIGWLMGKYGLACDNLVSVDIVTADGRFLTTSESENADLFWAVRGGGGNFGIVTSFEYGLHDLEPITAGVAIYPFAMSKDVLRFYREFTSSAPDSVMTMAGIMNDTAETASPGDRVAWIGVCHSGPEGEGEGLVRPIKEFGPPIVDMIGPMPYTTLQTIFDGAYPSGNRNYWRSNFLTELSDEAIDIIVARSDGLPSGAGTSLFFEHMQGAFGRVGEHDTAFSSRAAKHDFTVLSVWEDAAEDDKNVKWTREFGDAMKSLATGAAYVNYMMDDEGAERVRATYEANYERLVAIKKKYDPTNFFSGNQNIAPAT
jgi:FAD/FMN-containing dehydrogenase